MVSAKRGNPPLSSHALLTRNTFCKSYFISQLYVEYVVQLHNTCLSLVSFYFLEKKVHLTASKAKRVEIGYQTDFTIELRYAQYFNLFCSLGHNPVTNSIAEKCFDFGGILR